MVKSSQAKQEMQMQSLDQEDPLEKDIATHSSILAWRIPWTEESGRLQFTGPQRVWHNMHMYMCVFNINVEHRILVYMYILILTS